jgi:hypothetical protein
MIPHSFPSVALRILFRALILTPWGSNLKFAEKQAVISS